MTDDHYVTLGVEPKADAAVIRAAYHSLMRLYHPDRNDSPAASERARAIIAAFAVLGDAEKRLHYDWSRRRAAEPAPRPLRWYDKGRRYPLAAAFAVLALMLFLVSAVIVRTSSADHVATAVPTAEPAGARERAGDGLLTAERHAAVLPSAPTPDVPEFVPPSAPARPAPPPEEAQPEAVRIVPVPFTAPRTAPAPAQRAPVSAKVAARSPATPANARCQGAKAGAEATICNDDHLAALDQNVVLFFDQSMTFGAAAKRPVLLESRARFLTQREQCRSNLCLQHLHLAHLRELTSIIANTPPAPSR